jgi:hypothetical protein
MLVYLVYFQTKEACPGVELGLSSLMGQDWAERIEGTDRLRLLETYQR